MVISLMVLAEVSVLEIIGSSSTRDSARMVCNMDGEEYSNRIEVYILAGGKTV